MALFNLNKRRAFFLGILWQIPFSMNLFAVPMAEECGGCHGRKRQDPPSQFSIGIGHWRDHQCVGCHSEVNSIGKSFSESAKDPRIFGLAISDERLARLSQDPLPYGESPQQLNFSVTIDGRFDEQRLLNFLQRPSPRNREGFLKMMAYPDLSQKELQSIATHLDETIFPGPTPTGDPKRGKELWQKQCSSCHSAVSPISGFDPVALSLYTSRWLHAYANEQVSVPNSKRQMPMIPISQKDADDLFVFFGNETSQRQLKVDEAVHSLDEQKFSSVLGKNENDFARYMSRGFFRDAGCVHCHDAEGRAKTKFPVDEKGLARWLENNDPLELWRRLEIRAIEFQHKMGAFRPGMPMTGAPLPEVLRGKVKDWILMGCPSPEDKIQCRKPKNMGRQ